MQALDRARLRLLLALHPGLRVHPAASTNFAHARYQLEAGARLEIGEGAVTERMADGVRFLLGPGARVRVGRGSWLRAELAPVVIAAFAGAEVEIGEGTLLNGCHLSAKRRLRIGTGSMVGPGSRVFDSDQHDFDAEHPERTEPVEIGAHVWIASDVTVLRGVRVGDHAVVGAKSLVTSDVPPHTVVYGQPARPRGPVGDRSGCR